MSLANRLTQRWALVPLHNRLYSSATLGISGFSKPWHFVNRTWPTGPRHGLESRWYSAVPPTTPIATTPTQAESEPDSETPLTRSDSEADKEHHITDTMIERILERQYGAKWEKALNNPSKRKKLLAIKPTSNVQVQLDRLGLGLMPGNTTSRQKLKRLLEPDQDIGFPHMNFFAGAKQPSSFPKPDLPEIAFVGRSNVGKSTLVNALARTSVVRTSDKPGLTQQINFYCASRALNLVDMPGYGFAFTSPETRDGWQALIDNYFQNRPTLKRVFVLIDARTGFKVIDAAFIARLSKMKVKYTLVMTKCDSVPRPMLASRYMVLSEIAQSYPHCLPHVFMVSGKYMVAINDLRKEILHLAGVGQKYLSEVRQFRNEQTRSTNDTKSPKRGKPKARQVK
ncbi:hypothetical protein H4R33_006815 [Dimargaris cristalligena]|nr:hypothetical protein H4R33_006815 [Dimargaris cristalligena]